MRLFEGEAGTGTGAAEPPMWKRSVKDIGGEVLCGASAGAEGER